MANERYLIRRLLDGISGWLTYQQSTGAKTLYCEHFLYPPIHDIAKGRKWNVRAQQAINKEETKRGAPKTIDFILCRRKTNDYKRGLLFVEIKYLVDTNKTVQLRELFEDMTKLQDNDASSIEGEATISHCGPAKKFLLVIAQGSVFEAFAKTKSRKNPETVQMLASALSAQLPRSIYRSTVESKLKKSFTGMLWHSGSRLGRSYAFTNADNPSYRNQFA
jgi:hypothetical protein